MADVSKQAKKNFSWQRSLMQPSRAGKPKAPQLPPRGQAAAPAKPSRSYGPQLHARTHEEQMQNERKAHVQAHHDAVATARAASIRARTTNSSADHDAARAAHRDVLRKATAARNADPAFPHHAVLTAKSLVHYHENAGHSARAREGMANRAVKEQAASGGDQRAAHKQEHAPVVWQKGKRGGQFANVNGRKVYQSSRKKG